MDVKDFLSACFQASKESGFSPATCTRRSAGGSIAGEAGFEDQALMVRTYSTAPNQHDQQISVKGHSGCCHCQPSTVNSQRIVKLQSKRLSGDADGSQASESATP